MPKALERAELHDDEEGVAAAAARLGADGGPVAVRQQSQLDAEFEEFPEDDAWLDDELTDEELAALGEEDFELPAETDLEDDVEFEDESEELEDTGFAEEDELTEEELRMLEALDAPIDSVEEPPAEAVAPAPEAKARRHEKPSAVVKASEILPEDKDAGFDELEEEAVADDSEEPLTPADMRPVPRISIHAFCETPDMSRLLERAAVDRRLGKTHVTIHMGGLAKAVDHFQTASTPNLIIVEAVERGPSLFGQLGELAQVCDPSTKVIIIGRANDIALYRELMRQGVSDYIVRPRSPMQIISAIASLYIDPSAPPIGRTIAFVGARGGVGSSTLAHNVAWCAAEELSSDTVILDLDLPFGTASLDFEQDPTSGLIEALSAPERLDDVLLDRLLQKHTDRLSLFTAPNMLDRDYDLDEQAFETVIDVVRAAAPTIIVDVPHVWTAWSKKLLQTADQIVITATPDLASFRNTKNLVDVIAGSRPNDAAPLLVLNQFDPKVSSVQTEQFVEHVGLTPAAVIGWEPQLFHTAATNAAPILQVGSKSKTALAIRDVAARALGRNVAGANRVKFSLKSLLKQSKK